MGVRLQKISCLSQLFLLSGPFLHYRRFWAEDSLVKFGVHSWQTLWSFYPPCCIVNHLFVNVVKDVARSLVKQFSRLAGGFLSARLRLPLKDWESLGNSLYLGVLLQRQLSLKDQYSVDASDVSSILNSASYRMAALDEVTEASAATERTMKNLPQIGTKMGVKRPILQKL